MPHRKLKTVSLSFLLGFVVSALTAQVPAKPQYGAWGFDAAGADLSTKPGDNFFRYANGSWVDKTQIPADKPAYSLRLAMTDTTEQRLHDILEAAGSGADGQSETLAGKAGAFYRAFMDEATVEKLGATPIAPQLAEIKGAKSLAALGTLMGRNSTGFEHSIFLYGIDVDLKDPNHYAFYLTQGGLGLPDRDYYLKADFAGPKKAYQNYVTTILHLLDWAEPEKRAAEVMEFETKIAEASWTKAQQRDFVAIYNPMTPDELQKF